MTDPWARPADRPAAGQGGDDDGRPHRPTETSGGEHADRGHGPGTADGSHRGSPDGSHDRATRREGAGPQTTDPEEARAFGRPTGVAQTSDRGRDPQARGDGPPAPSRPAAPSPALASAFGRPDRVGEALQRPGTRWGEHADRGFGTNGHGTNGYGAAKVLWTETESDPWRDPGTGAELGGPALGETRSSASAPPAGPRLSARELVLGQRVAPTALALLAAVALLVGGAGGAVGYGLAGVGDELTDPGATLAQVEPGKERPAGSVADIAGRVAPAVVSLELRSGSAGAGGSGVVIGDDGHILTNNHVVELAATDPRATLEAVFASGLRAPARVVGRDPDTDLAVVKVNVANPRVAQLGRSTDVRVGDGVIAIGSPFGLAGTVTEGIVSSLNRPVRLEAESGDANPVIDAVQTDAAINPGNSGGALVDSTGAVIGLNTAIRTGGGDSGGGGSIGLGFAIPIDDARTIAEGLIRTGRYDHADLGVNAKSVTDGTADGAQVLNVRQGGAGSRAGLAEGDVVTRVGNRPIASADELVVAVREQERGRQVPLGVVRAGRPLVLQAVL